MKGKSAENVVKEYYERLHYEFLEQNYRYRRYEIDLIMLKDNQLLVFIEVKLRSGNLFGNPESFVDDAQQERILEAAES
jgi:putative endonuclease